MYDFGEHIVLEYEKTKIKKGLTDLRLSEVLNPKTMSRKEKKILRVCITVYNINSIIHEYDLCVTQSYNVPLGLLA